MASPQKENGYTATAHELIEAFCRLQISGGAHRVLRVIERKTYGFNKKNDFISISQFQKYTCLDRRTVTRALDELEAVRVVFINRDSTTNEYMINKDYDTWVGAETPIGAKMSKGRGENAHRTRGENATYKSNKAFIKTICDSTESQAPNKKTMPIRSYNENEHSDDIIPALDMDSREPIKKPEKAKRPYKEVYALFGKILGVSTVEWLVNTTEQRSADLLYTEKGLEQIEKALRLYIEHKDEEYCPAIFSPTTLIRKWSQLVNFKKKNGI